MTARGFGRVVLTSSMAQFGHYRQHAYAAAKAAVIGLMRSLAHDAEDQRLNPAASNRQLKNGPRS
jgi:NAD(P)-dependent dehydrogenase (short-subunit alcohol dehydrogenase family)